jgi:branched-chain amino acid transport system permease protein
MRLDSRLGEDDFRKVGRSTMLLDQLPNGIALGSIYALLSLGFTMVYGILFFINFPHGDVVMVGAYIALVLLTLVKLPFWIVLVLAMMLTALLGMGIEKIAYSRLRHSRRLAPLLSALGVSLVLSNSAMLIFGPKTKPFPIAVDFSAFGFFGLQPIIGFIIVVSFITMVLLQLFLKKTRTGIAIGAASQDLVASELVGINPSYVVSVTFAIGSALAAVSGMLLVMRYNSIYPSIGIPLMIKAFAACVLGGIGNIYGAVIGSFIIGITEVLTIALIGSSYRDIGAFVILILVLLLKPSGLFGGRTEVWV